MKNLSQDSQSLDQDLNAGPPEYKAVVLTTRAPWLVYSLIKTKVISHLNRTILLYQFYYFQVLKRSNMFRSRTIIFRLSHVQSEVGCI
jgi:hypothetical protein